MCKSDCVILAAGNSTRMNSHISKQFMEIGSKPILYYSLSKVINNKFIDNIYLVLEEKYIEYCKEYIIDKFFKGIDMEIVIGGRTRQESVYNALKLVKGDYVLIHDSARPFLSDECIINAVKYANIYDASSCYIRPFDTIKFKIDESIETLPREDVFIIQTPQCFKTELLLLAYDYVNSNNLVITDESSALDSINKSTYFYPGDRENIKITTIEDLYIGEGILKNIIRRECNEDI